MRIQRSDEREGRSQVRVAGSARVERGDQGHPDEDHYPRGAIGLRPAVGRSLIPQATEMLIPVFFLAKCHSGKTYKMVWHDKTADKVLTTILEEALKEAGAEEKEGTRPRNPAERRLRSWLQKVEGVY